MRIRLNGESRDVPDGTALADLLLDLAVDPARVAVAVNGEVVHHCERSARRLAAGDAVEVIEAVGGG